MSIATSYSTTSGSFMPEAAPSVAAHKPTSSGGATKSALRQMTDQTRLSVLAPRIEAALREMVGPGGSFLLTLSSNVETLQEGFIETLYDVLTEEKIDLSDKITLRLEDNALTVTGDHPEKARVDAALAKRSDLSAAFGEIASQSEILRDFGNISKVMTRHTGEALPIPAFGTTAYAIYQISLKGEMSHFYFAKK